MNSNCLKTYDVVFLTYKPKYEFFNSLKLMCNQSIKPTTISIYNTCDNLDSDKLFDINEFKSVINLLEINSIKYIVKDIIKDEFDHGKTRNDAASMLKSDYILFMTDDAVPYDNKLAETLIHAFEEYSDVTSKVAVAYARQVPKDSAKLVEKFVREFNYPDYDIIKEKSKEDELGIKNYFCSNVCAMYDRTIFNKLSYFEEGIILNEDTFYVYNAIQNGYKIVYKSDAKVLHSHNLSHREQFNRNFDIGVSQKDKEEFFLRIHSEKEGIKLIKSLLPKFIKGVHIISLLDFLIECIYKYFGFKIGKNYDKLSIDKCIEYANNKNYFIKKKKNG